MVYRSDKYLWIWELNCIVNDCCYVVRPTKFRDDNDRRWWDFRIVTVFVFRVSNHRIGSRSCVDCVMDDGPSHKVHPPARELCCESWTFQASNSGSRAFYVLRTSVGLMRRTVKRRSHIRLAGPGRPRQSQPSPFLHVLSRLAPSGPVLLRLAGARRKSRPIPARPVLCVHAP